MYLGVGSIMGLKNWMMSGGGGGGGVGNGGGTSAAGIGIGLSYSRLFFTIIMSSSLHKV